MWDSASLSALLEAIVEEIGASDSDGNDASHGPRRRDRPVIPFEQSSDGQKADGKCDSDKKPEQATKQTGLRREARGLLRIGGKIDTFFHREKSFLVNQNPPSVSQILLRGPQHNQEQSQENRN